MICEQYTDIAFYIYYYILNLATYYFTKMLLNINYTFDLNLIKVKQRKILNSIKSVNSYDSNELSSDSDNDDDNLFDGFILIRSAQLINYDYTSDDITNKLNFLVNKIKPSIFINDIYQYYPNAKYLNVQYYDTVNELLLHRIIHLKTRYDIKNKCKCNFGKIEL